MFEKSGESVGNRGMGEKKEERGRIHENFDGTDWKGSFMKRRNERENLVVLETHSFVTLDVRNGEIEN